MGPTDASGTLAVVSCAEDGSNVDREFVDGNTHDDVGQNCRLHDIVSDANDRPYANFAKIFG